jgi:hypothetical protein
MANDRYACVFCGKTIEQSGLDVCALLLVTKWSQPADQQYEQQFFCHFDCLRRLAHPSVPFYVADLDRNDSEK